MMKELTKVLAIAFIAISTISCGSSDDGPDQTKPTVDVKTPTADQAFNRGENLPLNALFKDNNALKNCIVSLSYNEATPAGSATLKGISLPWTPNDATIELSGKSVTKDLTNIFATPIEGTCKSGSYTLTFIVEDQAGNKSDPLKVSIMIN